MKNMNRNIINNESLCPMYHLSPRKFPRWLTITTFVVIAIFLSLATWQAQRGLLKAKLLNEYSTATPQLHNQNLLEHFNQASYQEGQEVQLTGKFDNIHYFAIDNHILDSKAGYLIIQPFEIAPEKVILVNRGWLPKNKSENKIPPIACLKEPVTISGQLYKARHNLFIRNNLAQLTWPQSALEIDIKQFSERLGKKTFPMVVNLHIDSKYSFIGPKPLGEGITAQRHFGYMVQWILFALIAFGIWYRTFKRWSKKQ